MYKHINKGTGTITLEDSKGNFHVIYPGGTVSMDRIYEGKGVVCINKDAQQVTIEQKQKITKNRKNKQTNEDDE